MQSKEILRDEARLKRQGLGLVIDAADYAEWHYQIIRGLVGVDQFSLAAYLPLEHEYNIWPVCEQHLQQKAPLSLPAVVGMQQALQFFPYQSRENLVTGAFGILEPVRSTQPVIPDVILCPLLAFDLSGARLGYGGGFYDRTLRDLRQVHPSLIAIGVGYSAQQVSQVPVEGFDSLLNFMLTEQGLLNCSGDVVK